MSTDITEEKRGISRRDLIKKGAVAGAIVWTVPFIESVPAYAVTGSGPFTGASRAFVVYVDCNNVGYVASYTNTGGNCTVGANNCYLPTTGTGTVSVSLENSKSGSLYIGNWTGINKQDIELTPAGGTLQKITTQDCTHLDQVGNTITAKGTYKIIAVVAWGGGGCVSQYINSGGTFTSDPALETDVVISGTGTGNSVTIQGL